jgi:NitT/TauT family transport system ATP-binding protein
LFGANGSGKSTLLGIISGLIKPDSGSVQFSQSKFKVSCVFQDYHNSLLPWRTVKSNILLPCRWNKKNLQSMTERLNNLLRTFTIDLPLDRYPSQISGGQAQLACLLRALICPETLILDEPTSALDFTLQWQTVLQIQRLSSEEAITTIVTSHDPDQAILVADKIVVLGSNPGRIVDVIDVDLPRPRTFAMTSSAVFLQVRDRLLTKFAFGGEHA